MGIAVLHSYFAMEMSRIDRGNDSLINIQWNVLYSIGIAS